jgi:hypothetical protein
MLASRANLLVENLALRQQLAVLKQLGPDRAGSAWSGSLRYLASNRCELKKGPGFGSGCSLGSDLLGVTITTQCLGVAALLQAASMSRPEHLDNPPAVSYDDSETLCPKT